MKCALVNLIPAAATIEIEDIGFLFWEYVCQSHSKSPHAAAREWLERMNDACQEEWGCDLNLNGILGIKQARGD